MPLQQNKTKWNDQWNFNFENKSNVHVETTHGFWLHVFTNATLFLLSRNLSIHIWFLSSLDHCALVSHEHFIPDFYFYIKERYSKASANKICDFTGTSLFRLRDCIRSYCMSSQDESTFWLSKLLFFTVWLISTYHVIWCKKHEMKLSFR